MQETARSRRRKAAAPHQPGAAFASFVLTCRYGGRGLRLIRADPPLHAGQPSPLWRARLPPPGLPTRRGPHWAALTAAARPPSPTGSADPSGTPLGSPHRCGAPALSPQNPCKVPSGGPAGRAARARPRRGRGPGPRGRAAGPPVPAPCTHPQKPPPKEKHHE